MTQQLSFHARRRAFWMRFPLGMLIYWLFCYLAFKLIGAYSYRGFSPNYYTTKNGSSFFTITGLSILLAFLLFSMAAVVASIQVIDKDENDFRKLSRYLASLMVLTAVVLPILGQSMVKASKAKEIEGIFLLADELKLSSPELMRLKIQYFTDFRGMNGVEAERIINDAKIILDKKLAESSLDGR
ncbi:hypothetical protein [Geothrix sp. PMB-07]|uniref:hypothetical protein n=1 Tax=Geothrix sp. PMB-07 TaxID=3068640 RepID=UPI00274181D7|nr:hypothetical protein [Geothrix sp. PMB-07]WLT33355.1 hypothetical protein Q9293_08450 [Geothrix sp. PMB-07]